MQQMNYEQQRATKTRSICRPLFRAARQLGMNTVDLQDLGSFEVTDNAEGNIETVVDAVAKIPSRDVYRRLQNLQEELTKRARQSITH